MEVIILQAFGAVTFLVGTVWLGCKIRRVPNKTAAVKASRISHLLYWGCLVLPGVVGLFYPGLPHYDQLLGVPSLPLRTLALAGGVVSLLAGLALMSSSNRSLVQLGRGTAAFLLTKHMVGDHLYHWIRNPMSLGYYLACVGVGLMGHSTTVICGALMVVIPIHAFNLRFFEERELELRFGDSYVEYKRRIPFLFPKLSLWIGKRV